MELFGVRILGFNPETLRKVVLSLVVLAVVLGVRALLAVVIGLGTGVSRRSIWLRKSIRLVFGGVGALLLLSIWFDNPNRLATFLGLLAGGLAFASQNAVLSVAGYFVIVFGKTFDLGDRIQIGDVRGDVLDIGLLKTTVMEMGAPALLHPEPHHWVAARQYTGRVVTVTNAEVFRQPTYNYTRNFNFLWEELRLPLRYDMDISRAESIILAAVREATSGIIEEGHRELANMRERYLIHAGELEPRAFLRLTDNWVELSVRFLVKTYGVRDVKDVIARRVLERFREEGIELASATVEVVRVPRLELRTAAGEQPGWPPGP
ncbi:mechanosensitive ion channel family protein [Myxococcus sp. AB025B]|uniref:mechanosensitive ion channel family protein n=1 Tax=Myxococcus sp. AB025B TaxID=2562794 RepID=UPI0011432F73|nr:mechanosensitive ion channel domain-containing protein [Myxococcus sp. AB025B]